MTGQYGERGPWHSGDEKPEIDGVYERNYGDEVDDCYIEFCYFKTGKFYAGGKTIEDAISNHNRNMWGLPYLPWRGLAKKP